MKKSAILLAFSSAAQAVRLELGATTESEKFGDIFGGLANVAGAMVGGDAGAQMQGIGGAIGTTANAVQSGDVSGALNGITTGVAQGVGGNAGQ